MSKILGLDLGTNSIGWALRDPDLQGNQIEKFGVLTFNKGVGIGKSGEYSYAAARTKKRATRRLYQARKYRLWATLENLITEGYCPLSIEDLNKWRHYDKNEALKNNNGGRLYPIWNTSFDAWIKLDFDGDGQPDYISPYQLRKELAITRQDFSKEENRFKLGRALYHIAQRRGFKSSRKVANEPNEREKEALEEIEMDLQKSERKKTYKLKELFPDFDDSITIGVFLANKEIQGLRIRLDVTQYLVRENYKDEIKHIFNFQELGFDHPLYSKVVETGRNKNDGSIFYKRPLRSQKGLIGKCTLEPSKYRAPISHPSFEIFRAWSFINNIRYKRDNEWNQLTIDLRTEIYDKIFFRKSKTYFPFSDIIQMLKKKGISGELNYKAKTTVSGCPVSARLKEIFGDDYMLIQIPKEKKSKTGKDYYDLEDIWHVLFCSEDQEFIEEFATQNLKLDAEKTKQFVIAWNALPVGYAMLSLKAIQKINQFLQLGYIYTEAALIAKIPDLIGDSLWTENEGLLRTHISELISGNRQEKTIIQIVNSLVSKHKNLVDYEKFGGKSYRLQESDYMEVSNAIVEHIGKNKWNSMLTEERMKIEGIVKDCYQFYFDSSGASRQDINGERYLLIRSNNQLFYKSDSGYFRVPKLIDNLKEFLRTHFETLDEKSLSRIYHPSEINIYPPAKPDKEGNLTLGSPKTGSFKNPMAMRALHELRKLINTLIESNHIDNETRVVVEVARDLNDANRRWAIEFWQRQRESENQEFAEAIKQLLNDERGIMAAPDNSDDVDKLRLFYEQNLEQVLPAVAENEEEIEGKRSKRTQKIEPIRWNGHGKKLVDKYRLWKEQGYQCMYTGKYIKLTDLFNEHITDFEHTIPRSQSFDNSLANLTVCYHDYNRIIKKNKLPVQLSNYEKDYDFGGNIGLCTAILPRLEAWKEKVERIKQQIDFWRTKSQRATDKGWKDDAIRQRHLWQMELDYWQNKLNRFTLTEITSGFKNSQLVDTQLISKYAFHYLKTYFDKVDVQKGSITSEFRKIYQLQVPDEKKDRSTHSHHAKDAAVLTLIPIAAKRDMILQKYYESKENKVTFTENEPYKGFMREFVWSIDDNVLIYNVTNNQELTPAKRKVRRRGKEIFISNTKQNMWATGDSIRGQLHQETFYGAIRPAQKGENGFLLKDEKSGKFIQETDVKYVVRIPFQYRKDESTPGFKTLEDIKKRVVDEGLKVQIEKQIKDAGGIKEAFERGMHLLDKDGKPHGNKIRHIRVWASVSEPLAIKKQTNVSDKEYKQNYWAANSTNSFFAIYRNESKKAFDFRNLFETAKILSVSRIRDPKDLFESVLKKGDKEFELNYVMLSGMKVIFKKTIDEDIKVLGNSEILKRLYVYTNFEKDGRMNFKFHLEARSDKDIKELYKDSAVNFSSPCPTLRLMLSQCDFIVENYDFVVTKDGIIKWLN